MKNSIILNEIVVRALSRFKKYEWSFEKYAILNEIYETFILNFER